MVEVLTNKAPALAVSKQAAIFSGVNLIESDLYGQYTNKGFMDAIGVQYKYLSAFMCLPMLLLAGCSASLDHRVNRVESVDIKQYEKRIDDVSNKITLIVNDTNRLHNEMGEVKAFNKTFQQKVEGLEVTVSNLNERISSLNTSAKTPEVVQPPDEGAEVKPQLSITNTSKSSEVPESDIQKTIQETTIISEQAKRELFVKNNIVRLAEAEFPDNKETLWNILSFEHTAHLTCVKVEPTSATVGYPRLEFIISFEKPDTPRVIRILDFKDGKYSLISTKKK